MQVLGSVGRAGLAVSFLDSFFPTFWLTVEGVGASCS